MKIQNLARGTHVEHQTARGWLDLCHVQNVFGGFGGGLAHERGFFVSVVIDLEFYLRFPPQLSGTEGIFSDHLINE